MQNFLGHDGFIWWVGVVEDIRDPDTLGRCKVRAFGYHDDEVNIPTADLPWATSIHSPNTSNLYSPLKVGDWVFGFFLDSLNAQEPAIVGVIPSKFANTQVTRSFNRVHTNGNSGNTTCLELGNSYIEVVEKSVSEPNGHIIISHNNANAKLTINTGNEFEFYTKTNINATSNNWTANVEQLSTINSNTFTVNSNTLNLITTGVSTVNSNALIVRTTGFTELYANNSLISIGNSAVFYAGKEFAVTTPGTASIGSGGTLNLFTASPTLRLQDKFNNVTLSTLITWIRTAWAEANSAHAKANSAFAAANTAASVAAAAQITADGAAARFNNLTVTYNANGYVTGVSI